MILKCIAIDDEPLALDLIRVYADQISSVELVKTFTDAIEGAQFLKDNTIDLIFLDILHESLPGPVARLLC